MSAQLRSSKQWWIPIPVLALLVVLIGQCLPAFGLESVQPTLASAPLAFETNLGQSDAAARFIARGYQCDVLLAPTEATLVLSRREAMPADPTWQRVSARNQIAWTRTVRLALQGANPHARMTGREAMPGKANYLLGDNPADWHTNVPLFAGVQVEAVYPGIDLVYYADQSARLEYDFVLQPNARADRISFHVEGADKVSVNAAGELVLNLGDDEVRQHRPVLYQEVNGQRKPVAGGYRLTGKRTVGFWIGDYDRQLPLVIDPVILDFSTYLGGSKAELGWCIAVDGTGIYVAGETVSKNLLTTPGAFTNRYSGGLGQFGDAFVAKYDLTGTNLIYLTYLGGKTDDSALAIAVQSGIAYLTGFTDSKNFPIVPTNNPVTQPLSGRNNNAFRLSPVNAFVTALNASGSALVFSTMLGGNLREAGEGIFVDGTGVYVAGMTESTNFIIVPTNGPNAYQTNFGGNADAFVTKLDLSGTSVIYSTFLGGQGVDFASSIAVDTGGNACITGFTVSTNFPTQNPITLNGITYTNLNTRTNFSNSTDAFIAKIGPLGLNLVYSTYLGGSNNDAATHIAVDGGGNAYVTGQTASRIFPTNTIPLPRSTGTNYVAHVFVTKVDPNGNLIYSTEFGGSQTDQGLGIAVDNAGQAFVTGFTSSTNFFARLPVFDVVTNCTQITNCVVSTNLFAKTFADFRAININPATGKKYKVTSQDDVFVAVLSPDATAFAGTNVLLGGAGLDRGNGIAVDPSGGTIYLVGTTTSPNFPITTNAPQTRLGNAKNNKASDAFVVRILILP